MIPSDSELIRGSLGESKDMRSIVLGFAVLLLVHGAALAAEPQTVAIEAADGFELAASYWQGEDGMGAVLLLHQCNTSRVMYERLGSALGERGFYTLSLDSRGFGESLTEAGSILALRESATSREDYFAQAGPIRAHWPSDMDAALDFLRAASGAATADIVLVGASCGGVEDVGLVDRNDPFAGLVLFSSAIGLEGEAILSAHPELPVLFVGSESDGAGRDNSVSDMYPRAFANAANPQTALHLYKGDVHGFPLFDADPALLPLMTNWIAHKLDR